MRYVDPIKKNIDDYVIEMIISGNRNARVLNQDSGKGNRLTHEDIVRKNVYIPKHMPKGLIPTREEYEELFRRQGINYFFLCI